MPVVFLHVVNDFLYWQRVLNTRAGMNHIQLGLLLEDSVHRLHENCVRDEVAGDYIQNCVVASVDEVKHAA